MKPCRPRWIAGLFLWGPAMESLGTRVRGRYGDKKAVTLSFWRYGDSSISMSIFSFFI